MNSMAPPLVDGDDHAAVAEPLGDAHAAFGGRPRRTSVRNVLRIAPGGIVAERSGVVGEPRQVEEGERPRHPHGNRLGGDLRRAVRSVTCPRVSCGDARRASVGRKPRCESTVRSWRRASRIPGGTGRSAGSSSTPTPLFDQLTDELLYHGDVNAALRRMMQDGMRGTRRRAPAGICASCSTGCARSASSGSTATTSAASTTRSPASSTTSSTRSATPIDNAVRSAERSWRRAPGGDRPTRPPTTRPAARPDARRPGRQGPRAGAPTTSSRPRRSSASSS